MSMLIKNISEYVTLPNVFTVILHIAGFLFLYINRTNLLYDDDDGNRCTPPCLSLGRCWSWALFYIACSYWLRYSMGVIPPTTPFPPALEEMLVACLLYEFAKRGVDIGKIWALRRGNSDYYRNSGSCNDYRYRRENDYDPERNGYKSKMPSSPKPLSSGSSYPSTPAAKAYSDDDDFNK